MSRAPFQILVLPYLVTADIEILYALFKRSEETGGYWQGIAGGGEDDETPLKAAIRESQEEAGIDEAEWLELDTMSMIPVDQVCGPIWGDDVLVIPNHCFGVRLKSHELKLSSEHTECRWVTYDESRASLKWDDNQNALWELNQRLLRAIKTGSLMAY